MARAFKAINSVSAGGYITLTPPAGELWIIGPDCWSTFYQQQTTGTWAPCNRFGYGGASNSRGAFALVYNHSKPFIVFSSGSPTMLSGEGFTSSGGTERTFSFLNITSSTQTYAIFGDISDMATEGIEEVFGDAVQLLTVGNTTDALVPQAGKSYQVTAVANGTSNSLNKFQLVDSSTAAVLLDNLDTYYSGFSKFWLWSDLGVKLRYTTVGGTTSSATFRAIRYADASLPEFTDRISIKQSVAAGAYVDVRPPDATEIWYIDLHNWPSTSLYPNGGASAETVSSVYLNRFRLSNDNWYRFKNNGGSATTLLVSGTKAKA